MQFPLVRLEKIRKETEKLRTEQLSTATPVLKYLATVLPLLGLKDDGRLQPLLDELAAKMEYVYIASRYQAFIINRQIVGCDSEMSGQQIEEVFWDYATKLRALAKKCGYTPEQCNALWKEAGDKNNHFTAYPTDALLARADWYLGLGQKPAAPRRKK